MELDMPEKTTQEFEGPGMQSRVENILTIQINADDGEDIVPVDDHALSHPATQAAAPAAAPEPSAAAGEKKSSKSSSKSKQREAEDVPAETSSRSKSSSRRSKEDK